MENGERKRTNIEKEKEKKDEAMEKIQTDKQRRGPKKESSRKR